ncbi:MAG: N-acetylneuraminate synthase [Nanoarchaeota archaeon]
MKKTIKIANKLVGKDQPCFIIAEAGINHNGQVDLAKKLVDEAKKAGADAVKFQTFATDQFLSKNIAEPKNVESILKIAKGLELSKEDHYELSKYCKQKGIIFISTPLDNGSVDLLDKIGVPMFKVASCDLDNLPLLAYIAKKGKPMIVSTGMAKLSEVEEAIDVIRSCGNEDIILLHCVSKYPSNAEQTNLNAMKTLETAFKLPVGYSDHTMGINISLAAVSLGAKVIEKHFTLDKKMEGYDHAISADPKELVNMINGIREVEKSFGTGIKAPSKDEIEMKKPMRRSIIANADIKKGEVIKPEMIIAKRPGTGISPKFFDFIVGRKATRDINKDEFIYFKDV